ncbi:MAG: selenium metabolism-associated LysR family transcriptional regulator [Singulisphaera sp.]
MADASSHSGPGELPHLSTFARAAEQGSFTAAAADLHITQAAVSQRMATLENELRVSLFDRRGGRIALTETGQRLYEYSRKILDLHAEARMSLCGFHPAVSGDLPIAASSVPGECYLPALLSAFRETYPLVHVRATVGDSGSVMNEVAKGQATLGLVGQKTDKPALESQPIGTDTLVLIVPPEHSRAGRRSITLKALAAESLIIREAGSGSRCALKKGLERAGSSLAAMNITLEMGSNAAIKDAVRRGLGSSFVSRSTVERELSSGELRAVPVRGLVVTRHLYVVHHRRRPLSPAAMVFLHFLQSHPLKPDRQ